MSVDKWAYEPSKCDGIPCAGDCDMCNLAKEWREICGTCKFYKCGDRVWKCSNVDSDHDECYTRYHNSCNEWEER